VLAAPRATAIAIATLALVLLAGCGSTAKTIGTRTTTTTVVPVNGASLHRDIERIRHARDQLGVALPEIKRASETMQPRTTETTTERLDTRGGVTLVYEAPKTSAK
jgi:hypothetical protein